METTRRMEQDRQSRKSGQNSSVAVMKFLEQALATGHIATDELQSKARAAGLLGERQRITNAKPFKAAKKQLGICSVREGFGPQGQWFWSLPYPTTPRTGHVSVTMCSPGQDAYGASSEGKETPIAAEAASVAEVGLAAEGPIASPERAAVLSSWRRLIDRLARRRPPAGIPRHRWSAFLTDCARFLSGPNSWRDKAADLGWSEQDLFGYPGEWRGSAGLLWEMNSGALVQIHRDWAEIETAEGNRRIFGRPSAIQRRALLQESSNGDESLEEGW